MGTAAFVILMVGCSDSLTACDQINTQTPVYETAQACENAIPDAMWHASRDAAYPQLLGNCVKTSNTNADTADISWSVAPSGGLIVDAASSTFNVADIK